MGTRSGHKSAARRAREGGRLVVGVEYSGMGADGFPRFTPVPADLDGIDAEDLNAASLLERETRRLSFERASVEQREQSVVSQARGLGESWEVVGSRLGVSAETARKRFGSAVPASRSA